MHLPRIHDGHRQGGGGERASQGDFPSRRSLPR